MPQPVPTRTEAIRILERDRRTTLELIHRLSDRAITTPLVAVAVPAGPLKAQHYVIDLYMRGQDRRFVSSYAFEVVRR